MVNHGTFKKFLESFNSIHSERGIHYDLGLCDWKKYFDKKKLGPSFQKHARYRRDAYLNSPF